MQDNFHCNEERRTYIRTLCDQAPTVQSENYDLAMRQVYTWVRNGDISYATFRSLITMIQTNS